MRRRKPSTGKSQPRPPKIGFLYWGYTDGLYDNYSADLFFQFVERAEKEGWDLDILGADGSNIPYPPLEKVIAGNFDALVLNGIWDEPYIGRLCALRLPMLALDYQPRGSAIDAVIFDGQLGGSILAQALVRTRQPDVLFVSRFRRNVQLPESTDVWIEDDTAADRRMGMQGALVGANVELWPMLRYSDGFGMNGAKLFIDAFKRLVDDFGRPPSVIAAHDTVIANSIWTGVEKMGYRVPQQIGLVSFDSKSVIERPREDRKRKVSSVEYDWSEMASRGWELLHRRLALKGKTSPPAETVRLSAAFHDHGTLLHR